MPSSARPTRLLTPLPSAEGGSVIAPDSAPAFRGRDPNGFDYNCGHCRGTVLIENTIEGEVWNLAFRCYSCQRISESPSLPSGRPIGRCAYAPHGLYRMTQTVDIPLGGCIVGSDATDQRSKEKGSGLKFDGLAASYKRGLAAHTPPSKQHRLMQLLDTAKAGIDSFAAGNPTVDDYAIVELRGALRVLEAWHGDPCWPGIVRSLENPTYFRHAVICLAYASFLVDAGNDVALQEETVTRSADIQIAVRSNLFTGAEVKSPTALQDPEEPISIADADRLVGGAMKDAGTGPRGQLSPDRPGLLAIGGFNLREIDLETLQEASRGLLLRTGGWRRHIVAISILSFGIASLPSEITGREEGETIEAIFDIRTSLNPQYTGNAALNQSLRPSLSSLPSEVVAVEREKDQT